MSDESLFSVIERALREDLGRDYLGTLDRQTMFFADLGLASIDAIVLGESLESRLGSPLNFGALMADLGRRDVRDLSLGELADFLRGNI